MYSPLQLAHQLQTPKHCEHRRCGSNTGAPTTSERSCSPLRLSVACAWEVWSAHFVSLQNVKHLVIRSSTYGGSARPGSSISQTNNSISRKQNRGRLSQDDIFMRSSARARGRLAACKDNKRKTKLPAGARRSARSPHSREALLEFTPVIRVNDPKERGGGKRRSATTGAEREKNLRCEKRTGKRSKGGWVRN